MPQLNRISRNNTKVARYTDNTMVTLHSTIIVNVTRERILLYTGGWFTATTRNRMNQVSNEMGLGYRVEQHKGLWRVRYQGRVEHFVNNYCELERV